MIKNLTLHDILIDVCFSFNVNMDMICSKTRKREILYPRYIFCYIAILFTDFSLDEIGILLNRDHTTIINAREQVKCFIKNNDKIFVDEYWNIYKEKSQLFEQLKRQSNANHNRILR